MRLVLSGILYRAKPDSQWPMLRLTFGPWQTVYGYCNPLASRRALAAVFSSPNPPTEYPPRPVSQRLTTRNIDAQSVKTATQGSALGYDPGKRVKGRKRLVACRVAKARSMQCKVTPANTSDADGLKALFTAYFLPGVQRQNRAVSSMFPAIEVRLINT